MRFVDALYGEIDVKIPPEILVSPELQRLREVRLCNVNSPFITGGANLNRFEHAIGTAYLAQELADAHSLNESEAHAFILASLLHDLVTAPFGHSLEYLFESLKNQIYEHANIWEMVFSGKTIPYSRPFYMDKKPMLSIFLGQELLNPIRKILEGNHALSKFLIKDIDLDNIDNVFRFAHHIGIQFGRKTPLKLCRNLSYHQNLLVVTNKTYPIFEEWFRVRSQLYKYLLEDAGEFAAKALLERCFIECVKSDVISEDDWILTDSAMVSRALSEGTEVARKCIQRYMLMDLPKSYEIMYSNEFEKIDGFLSKNKLSLVDEAFEHGVFLHFIRDVNKTKRILKGILIDSSNSKEIIIGEPNDRYLIGLFSDNSKSIRNILSIIEHQLQLQLTRIHDYEEKNKQLPLF